MTGSPEDAAERLDGACAARLGSGEPTSRIVIALVDRDRAVRSNLRELLDCGLGDLLHEAAAEIVEAGSAEELLARIGHGTRGCLITEIDLPGMTGPQLHDLLRAAQPGWHAVYMVNAANLPSAVQAIRSGAVDVIEKPFVSAGLTRVVADAVRAARQSDGWPRI